jgi:hypothetical protein
MAIGYPDFYSYAIIEQFQVVNLANEVLGLTVDGEIKTLFDYNFKGMIKKLVVRLTNTADTQYFILYIYPDGKIFDVPIITINKNMILKQDSKYLTYVRSLKTDNSELILEFSDQIIFFDTLQIKITGYNLINVTCSAFLWYFTPNPQIIYAPI